MSVYRRGIILLALITLTICPVCLADGNDRDAQPGFGQAIVETLEVVWQSVRELFSISDDKAPATRNGDSCQDPTVPDPEQCALIEPIG